MTTVGFIGLGSMGLPMASNLARRGFPVRGFDVRPDAVAALAEAGGDEKLLAEFRANQTLTINEVDQDAFRAATAPVLDKWEQKPFGDFVKRLRAAAAA